MSPCRSRQPRRLSCLVSLGSCYSLRWRSAWAHPPPAPTRRRRRWITISRRCGRRSFRHRAPRTPSAPAVPHLRALTSAARLRRLTTSPSSRARSSPAPRYSSPRTQSSAARFEGNGTTDAALRTCARQNDVQDAPTVTVDDKSVPVTEAETPLLNIVLPADNIFGLPAGTQGLSVGHGWVTLSQPLTPGTHTIVVTGNPTITTTSVVKPGH